MDAEANPASQERKGENFGMTEAKSAKPVSNSSNSDDIALLMQNRFVIRNGRMTVRVEDVGKSERAAQAFVKSYGGFVANSTTTGLGTANPVMTLTARVPVAKFDTALMDFSGLGVLMERSVSSDDVTGAVVDMDARLKVLRIKEELYYQMLKKARGINEIEDIQSKLYAVRTQIEQITAQRKSTAGQAEFSTIDLTLTQNADGSVAPNRSDWGKMAWSESGSAFQGFVAGFGTLAIWILTFAPVWLPAVALLVGGFFLVRRLGRRSSVGN